MIIEMFAVAEYISCEIGKINDLSMKNSGKNK